MELSVVKNGLLMDPPIKLFGQTIAFTALASQEDGIDKVGTTSPGGWDELSSSAQDGIESGSESGVKSELANGDECLSGSFPERGSSGSSGSGEEKASSPCEGCGLVRPASEASKGVVSEGIEDMDVEDVGFRLGEDVSGGEGGGKEPKMPKRPDKAVACPRCHSLETKFCYYNNYNVNQPRHFCKHCQRYWTAGGTLRNVPVGAGRRKNKHGMVPPKQTPDMGLVRGDEADVATPLLVGKGVPLPMPLQVPVVQAVLGGAVPISPKPIIRVPMPDRVDGVTTLSYTMPVPSLEATYVLASAQGMKPSAAGGPANVSRLPTRPFSDVHRNTPEIDGSRDWSSKKGIACATGTGLAGATLPQSVIGESSGPPNRIREDGGTAACSGGPEFHSPQSAPHGSFGFFNGGWPYGYNVGWSGGAAFCAGGVATVGNALPPPTSANVAAWSSAAAGSMWTGMPWPMPGLSWGPAGWVPPPWSMDGPWAMGAAPAGTAVAISPAMPTGGASGVPTPICCPTGPPGPSLGKHPRPFEGGVVDGTVWAPKSLRIADPEEAMRTSVWRILGVGSQPDPTTASSFKAFQPKVEGGKIPGDQQTVQASLQANPAAMSRSMCFHESN